MKCMCLLRSCGIAPKLARLLECGSRAYAERHVLISTMNPEYHVRTSASLGGRDGV